MYTTEIHIEMKIASFIIAKSASKGAFKRDSLTFKVIMTEQPTDGHEGS